MEGKRLENQEKQNILKPEEPGRQIQVTLNRPADNEVTIDLGNVFHNMKLKIRIYAWVLVLCMLVGACAPVVVYSFNRPMLTVSSVVTLRYEVPTKEDAEKIREGSLKLENAEFEPVSDLTAPDGTDLDLNQITSSYVLQTALDSLTLSQPVTAGTLRSNISIQTVLTEASSRLKESLAGLAAAKNAEAYEGLQSARMTYQNRFVVSLTNGFGDEDARKKLELKEEELRSTLNRVLSAYNDYLVQTYADVKMPEDVFSVIDIQALDVLESLDAIRAGLTSLYDYCNSKTETVKAYRSWQTGRNLTDWMESLQTFRSINVDSLYTMVSEGGITRDKEALLTSYRYLLRVAQNDLDKMNETIAETDKILRNYKNDEIYVSMQESDASRSTKAATAYYNELVLQQAENYEKAAQLKITVDDYTDRIQKLEKTRQTAVTEEVEAELSHSLTIAQGMYDEILKHMEELIESPLYTTYEEFSAPQGKTESLLAANMKKMVIGAVVGAVIACGLWFLAGLAPEFARNRKAQKGKEAA